MFALPICKPRFESINFLSKEPENEVIFAKKCKIFEPAGGCPPKPPASGGWGLRPHIPIGPGCWGLRPQTPKTASPIANFWLRACLKELMFFNFRCQKKKQIAQPFQPLLYLHVNSKTRLTVGILGLNSLSDWASEVKAPFALVQLRHYIRERLTALCIPTHS